jgi:uncharacterized repeat protein (TIGR03987 family)
MLTYATIFISLALLFYTLGVWSEKLQRILKYWHMYLFWIGVVFDTTGTTLMTRLTGNGLKFDFHLITGLVAILLMLFHAIWATFVLVKNKEKLILNFHKFSIFVWIIWLIPYLSGLIFGVSMK